jgi:magnesium and cobalt transporter
MLGKFPIVGEELEIENFKFKVLEANDRRVHLLEVTKTDEHN